MIKFFILIVALSQAATLKHLAKTSNALLVLADKPQCGYELSEISMLSQNLQADIDAKIMSLKETDLEIIKNRIPTCQQDCTCDIYALALEKKNQTDEALNQKASRLTMSDRKKCVKSFKPLCQIFKRSK